MRASVYAQFYVMELKRIFAYRIEFWSEFLFATASAAFVSYFLFVSIFEVRGLTELGGYSLQGLMLYYLLVPAVQRLTRGRERLGVSEDIYDGSLSRYLVYPVSLYLQRLSASLANTTVATAQLFAICGIYVWAIGIPPEWNPDPALFIWLLPLILLGLLSYFTLTMMLELVAFWSESVWGLLAVLRFSTSFLGGAMIPLSLYPEWSRDLLQWFPFIYQIGLPLKILFGKAVIGEIYQGLAVLSFWWVVTGVCAMQVWKRGLKNYSGVGQ